MIRLLATLAMLATLTHTVRANVGTVLYMPQVLREMPTIIVAAQCPMIDGLDCIQSDEQP